MVGLAAGQTRWLQLAQGQHLRRLAAAEHLRRYRRSHSGIDLVHYAVAATAELHDAELATLHVRHFPMFKDLRPPW